MCGGSRPGGALACSSRSLATSVWEAQRLSGVVGLAVLCRAWARPWHADTPPCCEWLGWVLPKLPEKRALFLLSLRPHLRSELSWEL